MKFCIRPQAHKITFYSVVPYLVFTFVYFFVNPFGNDEGLLIVILFVSIIGCILLALMALFKPWLESVDISDNIISQSTSYGGEIKIDIHLLDLEHSFYSDSGLSLVTTEGANLILEMSLFNEPDLMRVAKHINLIREQCDV